MTRNTGATGLTNSTAQPSIANNNANFGLMRLVFSAIFHMHPNHKNGIPSSPPHIEDPDSDDEGGEIQLKVANPSSPPSSPPLRPALTEQFPSSSSYTSEFSRRKLMSSLPTSSLPTSPKQKDLITLVLSGFENHNRVSYLTKAYQRFVPNDFLSYLGKDTVEHVDIGDSMMTHIATVFIEIHGYRPRKKTVSSRTMYKLQHLKRQDGTQQFPPAPSQPTQSQQVPPLQPAQSTQSTGSLKPTQAHVPPQILLPESLLQSNIPVPPPQPTTPTFLQPAPSQSSANLQPSSSFGLPNVASRSMFALKADLISFQFLNAISQKLLPIIRQHDGYVDKFFGNAILALFPSLEAATRASLDVVTAMKEFENENTDENGEKQPVYARIG